MADFIEWWQAADIVAQATVIGTITGILAFLWTVFSYARSRNHKSSSNKIVAKNGSVAAGRDVSGNTISGCTPTYKR